MILFLMWLFTGIGISFVAWRAGFLSNLSEVFLLITFWPFFILLCIGIIILSGLEAVELPRRKKKRRSTECC
jgi:ABC-type multidrug transport system permease subunit